MLTEERIQELAAMASRRFPDGTNLAAQVIRLAVAETAEACVGACRDVQAKHRKAGRPGAFWIIDECVEAIRAAAKGAK